MTRPGHQIDARTLSLMIGYSNNDIDTLKQSVREPVETGTEWDMLEEKERQEWGVSSLLIYARLKGGICEYAHSPALAEKLHDPKLVALINLNMQRRFTSAHALALYENFYRFMRTCWWDINLFRRLMGVADSSDYEVFRQLNAKIIKPTVAEVNKTSNIVLTPETKREGRAGAHIRSLIAENPLLSLMEVEPVANSPIGRFLRDCERMAPASVLPGRGWNRTARRRSGRGLYVET